MKHSRGRVGCVWVLCAYRGNNQLSPCAKALPNSAELFSCVTNPTSFKGQKFCYSVEKEAPLDNILTI
jgi:hypothetical protein